VDWKKRWNKGKKEGKGDVERNKRIEVETGERK
jgi:hypothetical protein